MLLVKVWRLFLTVEMFCGKSQAFKVRSWLNENKWRMKKLNKPLLFASLDEEVK